MVGKSAESLAGAKESSLVGLLAQSMVELMVGMTDGWMVEKMAVHLAGK